VRAKDHLHCLLHPLVHSMLGNTKSASALHRMQ
jgi:hypothetical protein